MAIEVVTKEDLEIFRMRLIEDLKMIIQPPQAGKKAWLKGNEVRQLLKISPGTLQNFRVSGWLHPSKVGGILYYQQEEIIGLLEKGTNHSFQMRDNG